jgi:hypothetical protein
MLGIQATHIKGKHMAQPSGPFGDLKRVSATQHIRIPTMQKSGQY